jgi:hypothetical protein
MAVIKLCQSYSGGLLWNPGFKSEKNEDLTDSNSFLGRAFSVHDGPEKTFFSVLTEKTSRKHMCLHMLKNKAKSCAFFCSPVFFCESVI